MTLRIPPQALGSSINNAKPQQNQRSKRIKMLAKRPNIRGDQMETKEDTSALVSRGDERLAKLRTSIREKKIAATSAAHTGVVARPMDQNLSKMLEQRRAQFQESGTSIARIGKKEKDLSTHIKQLDERAPKVSNIELQSGTSVARIKQKNTPSYLPPIPITKKSPSKKNFYGDL